MTTSLNGWAVVAPTGAATALARRVVPGTTRSVTLQKDALPLFLAFLADWHKTVMPIDGSRSYLGPDGWEYRMARTGAGWSSHSSGTAVDVRYDVLRADHQRHMTPAQIDAVHKLLDKYVDDSGRRVFGWGGDWTVGTFCDEMHTELAQSWAKGARGRATTLADVRAVIKRLNIRPDGTFAVPAPAAAPWGGKNIGWLSQQRPQIITAQYVLGVKQSGTYLPLIDRGFRAAIEAFQKGHATACKKDGSMTASGVLVKPGVIGPHLYESLLAYYPKG